MLQDQSSLPTHRLIMLQDESQANEQNIPVQRKGFFFWVLANELPQTPKHHRLLPLVIVTLRNVAIRPYCWSCRTWRHQAGPDLKDSSLLAGFIVLESAVHSTRGKNHHLTWLWSLRATTMTGLARHAHQYNCGMNIMVVTNHFLIGLKLTPKDETHTWYHY